MATLANVQPPSTEASTENQPVDLLYTLLEDHLEALGLSEQERDQRYAAAANFVTTANAEHAKPAA